MTSAEEFTSLTHEQLKALPSKTKEGKSIVYIVKGKPEEGVYIIDREQYSVRSVDKYTYDEMLKSKRNVYMEVPAAPPVAEARRSREEAEYEQELEVKNVDYLEQQVKEGIVGQGADVQPGKIVVNQGLADALGQIVTGADHLWIEENGHIKYQHQTGQ